MEPIENKGLERAVDQVRRAHGSEPLRGLQDVARSTLYEGRFGRMFRNLPPFLPPDQDLIALAGRMFEPAGSEEDEGLDTGIPAGFTYLGQFIDHDITFDPSSKLQEENDPDALHNFRTPRFDLDSVYSSGPSDVPFLYDQASGGFKLLIDKVHGGKEEDLPRNSQGRALIGDPRNDENLIVSQLQLLFLKFHNRVYDSLAGKIPDPELRFDEARRVVRWHYQWIVVHNFLAHVVGNEVVNDILKVQESHVVTGPDGPHTVTTVKADLKFFNWKNQPFMPVEFAVAAYRFGHSLIRFEYELNDEAEDIPIFGKNADPKPPGDLKGDLRGFRPRPEKRVIEWERFFNFPGKEAPQHTRKFDTKLARGLSVLPGFGPAGDHGNPPSLAERNLRRGKALGLPSGQAVANAMSLPGAMVLTDAELDFGPLAPKFVGNAPLWYYILKEAEVKSQGKRLGPVGGRIVAEVLIGLLDGDPASYLSMSPNWQPKKGEFGAPADGTYNMPHLVSFAQGK
jgi:hypothetical protein